jgi:hypothetical protein
MRYSGNWPNLRRYVSYDLQYFAAIEPQRGLAPHVHIAMRGTIARAELRRVNVRCGQPARRSRASSRASAITIYGTISPACSSRRARTSRRSRHVCGTPAPRPPSTPTGTSGPTRDESTRAAIEAVITARAEQGRNRDQAVR